MSKNKSDGLDTIVFYKEWAQTLHELPESLRYKILDALIDFVLYQKDPTDTTVLYSPYLSFKQRIIADKERYAETCRKRRDNVNARYQKADE